MKTKLLRRLRRLARRKIEIEYHDKYSYVISLKNKEQDIITWDEIGNYWHNGLIVLSVRKKDIIKEYKKATRRFILDVLDAYKVKRGRQRARQLNKQLKKGYGSNM